MNRDAINATLETLLPEEASPLHEAAHYSLKGGKRLRPLLLLSVLESAGVDHELGLYPACALEMIHTYSLIHDDLPCMDDDDMRRGKPTLHKVYPEAHALLVGDFLLTHAFEVLSKAPMIDSDQRLELIRTLSESAGGRGMIGGQLLDLEGSTDWQNVHKMKTGALIQCALVSGGIIAKMDLDPLKAIGHCLGVSYQLVDDLIDGDGAVEQFGRSWVEGEVAKMEDQLHTQLSHYTGNPEPLQEMANRMIHRTV